MDWYPLTFDPVYKDYVWGGSRIAKRFDRLSVPPRCAESWECSTRPEGMSVVNNGKLAGQSLAQLIRENSAGMLGSHPDTADFPLLIKIIDAHQRLSVQVHPHQTSAASHGGEPKTEAWYVLDASPDACIYRGLHEDVTRERLARAVQSGRTDDVLPLLRRHRVSAGDVVFVPGGQVHAIGAGILLLEVQQNSNTTYRLFDWGRPGSDGKPRELHVERALSVVDWGDAGAQDGVTKPLAPDSEAVRNCLQPRVSCPWFVIEETCLTRTMRIANDGGFNAWFVVSGKLKTSNFTENSVNPRLFATKTQTLPAGSTVLVPAAIDEYAVSPGDGSASCRAIRVSALLQAPAGRA